MAQAIASTGAEVLVIERGEPVRAGPHPLSPQAVFNDINWLADETWYERDGRGFNPVIYYYVGGNTKFFGAVMMRYRRRDFEAVEHLGGLSPAWPFPYDEMEPWYCRAEEIFRVRGETGQIRSSPRVPGPCPTLRSRTTLRRAGAGAPGANRSSDFLHSALRGHRGLARLCRHTWDGYPNTESAKADAENTMLNEALAHDNVRLLSGATVTRMHTDTSGKTIVALDVDHRGSRARSSRSGWCSRPARSTPPRCCCAPPTTSCPTALPTAPGWWDATS